MDVDTSRVHTYGPTSDSTIESKHVAVARERLAKVPYTLSPCRAATGRPVATIPRGISFIRDGPDYLRLVFTSRVYEGLSETPLTHAVNLSNRLGCRVLLKREDLQPTFSSKLRGAYNQVAHLTDEQRQQGIVTCSAGNYAQAVAYAARQFKVPATIVMSEGASEIQRKNILRLGGLLKIVPPTLDEAILECSRLQQKHDLVNLTPFDDPHVIAGQGTIGLELLRQINVSKLTGVFCYMGGGSLIAGVGTFLKRMAPGLKIIGVTTTRSNAMVNALKRGNVTTSVDFEPCIFALPSEVAGKETYRLCREFVDEIIEVSTDEICASTKDIFEDTRAIVDPAGALAVAGLKKYVSLSDSATANDTFVAITSAASLDFNQLRFIADRAAIGEKKEALLRISINEAPGSFANLLRIVAPVPITGISYRFAGDKLAHLLATVGVSPPVDGQSDEVEQFKARLIAQGMQVSNLTSDELTRSHLHCFVGGRAPASDERVYMFRFPERPGSLRSFLGSLQSDFNISLFHYKYEGGDVAHVLIGIQCPQHEDDVQRLESFLSKVGFPYKECTDNETLKLFLTS